MKSPWLAVGLIAAVDFLWMAEAKPVEPAPKKEVQVPELNVPAPAVAPLTLANEKILLALDKPATVEFIDLPLDDALQFVGEYLNITLRRDKDAIQAAHVSLDHPVNLKLESAPCRSVLKLLLEPLALDVFVDEGELVVTKEEKAATHFVEFSYSAPHQLAEIVSAGISLPDLAEAITQTVDAPSWQKNGGQGALFVEQDRFHGRQREDVQGHIDGLLRELRLAVRDPRVIGDDERLETNEYSIAELQNLGVPDAVIITALNESLLARKSAAERARETATIKGDRLILTQPRWIHAAAAEIFRIINIYFISEATPASARAGVENARGYIPFGARRRIFRKKMAQPISVNFRELPLEDVLSVWREQTDSQMVIVESLRGMTVALGGATGVLDSPVSLKADHESPSILLDKILAPLKLDWYVIDPDIIVVTMRGDAAKRMEPRVYPTKDILAAGGTEKGLLTQIAAIAPNTWATKGGLGQLRPLPGVLIVNHNRRVHEQIERLLASLKPKP